MVMHPHGRPLLDYRCDNCHSLGSCTKGYYVTDISDVLIIQLVIFKFTNGRMKKVIPSLCIDEEITIFGSTMTLDGVIYHEGNQPNSGHYVSGVKVNERWFLISDSNVSCQLIDLSAQISSRVPYMLLYKKKSNMITHTPVTIRNNLDNSVSNTVEAENVSTSETMNRQSLLKELHTQEKRISNANIKQKANESIEAVNNLFKKNVDSNKIKSPVKRKLKYGTTVTSAKRMAKLRDNLNDDVKRKIQDENTNYQQKKRTNLDDDVKRKIQDENTKKHQRKRYIDKDEKLNAFKDVQGRSMVDPSILTTTAYKIIKEQFQVAIEEGPTYICDICWKFEYRKNVIKLDHSKYEIEVFYKCHTRKSEWICKSCHKSISKNKMPMQAQANNLWLCQKFDELECLCPIELMLISQIIPFMFIVAKHKGAQHGLKGQCVLVPADLKKIQTILPRSCNEEYLISLALKRRLSDTSIVNKQHIRPAFVNRALEKLVEVNPFYKDVRIDNSWEDISEESDPDFWKLLTDRNAKFQNDDETDSDDEIDGNDHVHENEKKKSSIPYPTVLHNIDGPNISPDQVVNIAPGEGQIPVSVTSEPDWEALAFPKDYSTGKYHFNEERDVPITPSKYIHARLKCCDDRFASNPQYIFHALDWVERNAVSSSIHFAERKQFQSDVSAGQLMNSDNVRRMISDDQIFASFKNIRGTPQYFHNMMLDVLAKVRQFGVPTFFLTFSAAEFHWPEIIKIVARQYGETLTTEQVNAMDWSTKAGYIKRNPVTVSRQIDYIFRQVFGKVIYSGMHPIGQVLNHDDRREFQSRGVEHVHTSIHVVGAPKIDENEDSDVVEFIDKYITCSMPDENQYPDLQKSVKSVQTHHHTITCRKKKGVTCRFNAPWPPSEKTCIIRGNIDQDELEESKRIVDKVLSEMTSVLDLSDVTLEDILETCGVSHTEYNDALANMQKKLSIIYKRRPCEKDISP